jgi:hypothetical protein
MDNIRNWQNAVLQNYGNVITPHKGPTFAAMSSGKMRDENDAGFVQPNSGTQFNGVTAGTADAKAVNLGVNLPPSNTPIGFYLSKQSPAGGLPGGKCGNTTCLTGNVAHDSIDVQIKIRVPTNAQSFSYDFRFFSAEYQTYQCTTFNDFYLALLTSSLPQGIPADHNISFDSLNKPVSVNNGFFEVCPVNFKNCSPCPGGTAELAGTGMEINNTGGGTTWLTTDAPIVPGEIITLDLMLFDVGDKQLDSLVILDNFRWNLSPATVNTHQ